MPDEPARQSAGTIHHIAWNTTEAEHGRWLDVLQEAGIPNSGAVDRHYFRSIYFREPGGILFELATAEPGFTVDGPVEELGHEDHPAALARAAAGRDRVAPDAAARPAGRLGARDTLMSRDAGACAYVLGADGLTQWREPHSGAWLGLLQAHRQLTRELESRLEARFGLSLSGLELLGRLAAAPGRRLRLSALAGATGLTLSRISRHRGRLREARASSSGARAPRTAGRRTRGSRTPGSSWRARHRPRTSRTSSASSSTSCRPPTSRRWPGRSPGSAEEEP